MIACSGTKEEPTKVVDTWPDGKVKILWEAGREGGILEREFDVNGNLIRTSSINANNLKHGIELKYYSTGKMKKKENFSEGLRHGYSIAWYASGEPYIQAFYSNDTLIYLRKYFENGQLMADVPLSNGVLDSTAVYYNQRGEVTSTGHWRNNKKECEWVYYDEGNKVHTIELYRNDTLINVDYF